MMRKVLTQEKESAIESLRVEMRDEHSQYLRKEEHEISAIQRLRSNHASEMETLTQKHMRDETELNEKERDVCDRTNSSQSCLGNEDVVKSFTKTRTESTGKLESTPRSSICAYFETGAYSIEPSKRT